MTPHRNPPNSEPSPLPRPNQPPPSRNQPPPPKHKSQPRPRPRRNNLPCRFSRRPFRRRRPHPAQLRMQKIRHPFRPQPSQLLQPPSFPRPGGALRIQLRQLPQKIGAFGEPVRNRPRRLMRVRKLPTRRRQKFPPQKIPFPRKIKIILILHPLQPPLLRVGENVSARHPQKRTHQKNIPPPLQRRDLPHRRESGEPGPSQQAKQRRLILVVRMMRERDKIHPHPRKRPQPRLPQRLLGRPPPRRLNIKNRKRHLMRLTDLPAKPRPRIRAWTHPMMHMTSGNRHPIQRHCRNRIQQSHRIHPSRDPNRHPRPLNPRPNPPRQNPAHHLAHNLPRRLLHLHSRDYIPSPLSPPSAVWERQYFFIPSFPFAAPPPRGRCLPSTSQPSSAPRRPEPALFFPQRARPIQNQHRP